MTDAPEDPRVGGTRGEASGQRGDETESAGSGEVEIPIGVPVSDEEFRRLKAEATKSRDDRAEATQEDVERDDSR